MEELGENNYIGKIDVSRRREKDWNKEMGRRGVKREHPLFALTKRKKG